MTKQEALALFSGSPRQLGAYLDISEQAINQWRDDEIPALRAYQLRDYMAAQVAAESDSATTA